MIISLSLLNSVYKAYKEKHNEIFIDKKIRFELILLILVIIFFIMEFFLMLYAINIAIKCSKSGAERIVSILLAIVFTLPYTLSYYFFSPCGRVSLRNSNMLIDHSIETVLDEVKY